ncbi:hypothetical protein GZH47_14555 [Paenibacillus rhizovicinus]|uniref:DUF7660 domain-containing protein n=1 Tax=Paenibacillus rhizovicinus TaxID=2704463 RepID=A0A6C0P0C5_9BACL|nr:hypothetical protein [Paenibacillus rhizovicinus]QHW31917.1 hypothetical protein GZH47_14555 [Paenibacillus rhizovicinus]
MQLHEIRSKNDFLRFLTVLRSDLVKNSNDWENPTLDKYLEAMQGWIQDMDGYYSDTDQTIPEQTWKVFADILYAAKIYE